MNVHYIFTGGTRECFSCPCLFSRVQPLSLQVRNNYRAGKLLSNCVVKQQEWRSLCPLSIYILCCCNTHNLVFSLIGLKSCWWDNDLNEFKHSSASAEQWHRRFVIITKQCFRFMVINTGSVYHWTTVRHHWTMSVHLITALQRQTHDTQS